MIIKIEHRVPYDEGNELRCVYNDGECYGRTTCLYHTFRDRYFGSKAAVEYKVPKCKLFDAWLDAPYQKCGACLRKCIEAGGACDG